MKKATFSLATLGLTLSLGAFAAVPTGASPFQIIVPNLKSGMELTLEGILVQPRLANLDYATEQVIPLIGSNTNTPTAVSTVDPSYDFGFRVGVGYVFANTGNDMQLAWTHFTNSNGDSVSYAPPASSSNTIVTVFMPSGLQYGVASGLPNTTISGNNRVNYDAVDLDMGQYLSVGTRLTVRAFAGLRAAQLKQTFTDNLTTYTQVTTTIPTSITAPWTEDDYIYSQFSGIGPRFGVDSSYDIWKCLGVVAHASGSLLIGQEQSNSSVGGYIPSLNPFTGTSVLEVPYDISVGSNNVTRVVPVLEGKIGLDYSLPFHNDAQRLTIEAGYEGVSYINALDQMVPNMSLIQGAFVVHSVNRKTSNFGYQGPYLSLNLKI